MKSTYRDIRLRLCITIYRKSLYRWIKIDLNNIIIHRLYLSFYHLYNLPLLKLIWRKCIRSKMFSIRKTFDLNHFWSGAKCSSRQTWLSIIYIGCRSAYFNSRTAIIHLRYISVYISLCYQLLHSTGIR